MTARAGESSFLADRIGGRRRNRLIHGRVSEQLLDLGPVRRRLGDKWERAAPSVRRFARLVIDRHIGDRDSVTLNGDIFVIQFVGVRQESAARTRMEMEDALHQMLFGSGEPDDPGFPAPRRRAANRRTSRHRSMFRWFASLRSVIPTFRFPIIQFGGRETTAPISPAPPTPRRGSRRPVPDHAVSAMPVTAAPVGTARAATLVSAAPGSHAPGAPAGATPVGHVSDLPAGVAAAPDAAVSAAPAGSADAAVDPQGQPPVAPSSPPKRDDIWWQTNATPAERTAAHRDGAGNPSALSAGEKDLELEFVDGVDSHPEDAAERDRIAAASSRSKGRVRRSSTDALERALYAAIEEAQLQSERMRVRIFPPLGTRCLFRPMWLVESGVLPIYTCIPACALGPFEFVTGEALIPNGAGPRKIAALDEMVLDTVVSELAPRQRLQLSSFICIPVHLETLLGDRAAPYFGALDRIPESIRHRVLIEIVDISQGVGQLGTYSLVRKLKARVRSVIGRVDLSDMNFRIWRETDLSFIGVDIECETRPESEQIADLNNFVVPARQYGLRAYVRGVRTLSLAAATVASGFDYVDGPAVSEGDFTLRTEPQPFGIYDIYM